MAGELPDYYFRIRENGAAVFRVDTENRQRRIELDQIALVNVNKGEVKPHGDTQLTEEDIAAIQDWLDKRVLLLAQRDIDDIHRAVDYMNVTTQWVQSKASEAQLEDITDALAAGDARPAHGAGAQKGRADDQSQRARTIHLGKTC